jgi:ABC-type multidrug transport system ATPase subunit
LKLTPARAQDLGQRVTVLAEGGHMASAIQTARLTKDYGGGHGIFDLDLDVREGEVFGFLGPNGAGKTTTIKLLMGLSHATRGAATIFGLDVDRDAVAIKKRVAYVPGELPQFGGWRGTEIAAYIAGLRGDMPDAAVAAIATRLDLDLGRKYREYSHGNKQKLALLLAFAPEVALLILDEPTSGLDPLHQQEFYQLVRDARARGATVFVSSHVLSEVEHICDRVAIVREGHLATIGRLDELAGIRAHRVRIEFAAAPPVDRLRGLTGFEDLAIDGRRVSGLYRGGFDELLRALADTRVVAFESREPTLEEVFLTYYSAGTK